MGNLLSSNRLLSRIIFYVTYFVFLDQILTYDKLQQIWFPSGSDKLCNPFQQCIRCPWSFLSCSDRHIIEEQRKGHIFPGICKDPNHENDYEFNYSTKYEFTSDFESDCCHADSVPDRLALGLNPSGPLKLEDVKIAWVP